MNYLWKCLLLSQFGDLLVEILNTVIVNYVVCLLLKTIQTIYLIMEKLA